MTFTTIAKVFSRAGRFSAGLMHQTTRNGAAPVGSFVPVYRYRTIQRLFDEAFRNRAKLAGGFRDLEALLLSFAVARRKAGLEALKPQPELIEAWVKKWVPKFAKRRGPKWTNDWKTIEIVEAFSPPSKHHYGVPGQEWHRRDYG